MSKEQTEQPKIDKSAWPDGPWQTEPDRVQFQHAGYACLITRHHNFGTLCGYVGVDNQHPMYGKDPGDVGILNAHGGVNYSNKCSGHICHVPEPGMPDDVWWFGFDCNHCFDIAPGMIAALKAARIALKLKPERDDDDSPFRPHYRDLEYVTQECEQLADQLRALADGK